MQTPAVTSLQLCTHTSPNQRGQGTEQEGKHSGSAGSQCTQEAQLWEVL